MTCPPCNNHCNNGLECPDKNVREIAWFQQFQKSQRNDVLEEVAKRFDAMPFGDTSASFARYVRNMKDE
jgi:hypothetical protein